MTPEQHAQRIRQLEFQLHKADYGMGMPRDYQRVLELRTMLEQARKEAEEECAEAFEQAQLDDVARYEERMDSDYDEQAGGY